MRAALRTYALRVLAHADGDEEGATMSLLDPLLDWQSRGGKAAKVTAPPADPSASASV